MCASTHDSLVVECLFHPLGDTSFLLPLFFFSLLFLFFFFLFSILLARFASRARLITRWMALLALGLLFWYFHACVSLFFSAEELEDPSNLFVSLRSGTLLHYSPFDWIG